jgi:hypothetical protein
MLNLNLVRVWGANGLDFGRANQMGELQYRDWTGCLDENVTRRAPHLDRRNDASWS